MGGNGRLMVRTSSFSSRQSSRNATEPRSPRKLNCAAPPRRRARQAVRAPSGSSPRALRCEG
eukprot:3926653-Pyramimonas_sp.AAC.1